MKTSSSVGRLHGDIRDPDVRAVEPAHGLGDPAALASQRHHEDAVLALRSLVGERRERLDRGGLLVVGLERHLEALAAHAALELVGGALRDHLAVVDHRDAVREPVGLVEVLGREQHGRAGGHARLDRLPELEAAARVEPGGGLVEEQHRRAGHQRRGEVESAAHAAGVGLRQAVGGVGEREALEQLARALLRRAAAEVVEPPDHLEVLEAGEVLVDGRVLARRGRSARAAPPRPSPRRGPPHARCRRRAAAAS